jgi:hypothetical protein
MAQLKTTREVIRVLGGVRAVAELTESTYNAAWNWTTFETFPADTADAIRNALKKAEGGPYTAPSSLWRMRGIRSSSKRRSRGAVA